MKDAIGDSPSTWEEGYLDLHHINTGRGNCTYAILPDGSTLLIDAGQVDVEPVVDGIQRRAGIVPDDSLAPWEWIARYVEATTRHRDPEFDQVWLTHFHSDHLGHVRTDSPLSRNGAYRLAGLTGVCDRIPFGKLIDRGWPDYDYPLSAADSRLDDRSHGREGFANTQLAEENYRSFLEWHRKERSVTVERFRPGRDDQIGPVRDRGAFPDFGFRNVYANGEVWTGTGADTRPLIPPVEALDANALPNENTTSCAGVMSYGAFRYFSGGDITGIVELGAPDWFDVESHVADVVGPVDAAVLNHHAYRDTHNEHYVATLRPRIWIGFTWSADQPGHGPFKRLTSTYLYPGDRDLFATNMFDANRAVIGPALDRAYKSTQGHILLRVAPGGDTYRVVIVDEATRKVKDVFEYETQGRRQP